MYSKLLTIFAALILLILFNSDTKSCIHCDGLMSIFFICFTNVTILDLLCQ